VAASDTISWAFARAVQRRYPVRGSIWVNAYLLDPSPRTLFAVATMTAIVHDDYGTIPEDVLRLEEVGKPTIAVDQVLVRVHAASVDRGTWHIMAGLPYPIRVAGFGLRRPKYLNPGRSLAGTVEAVGNDATGFKPGDEVSASVTAHSQSM
jgi:NADPH:quinone reductase-like Zn-dependent oxidoreductase